MNPPWIPDQVFDDATPNVESPDLEVTFPPHKFDAANMPLLMERARKSGLPRAVVKGMLDIESIMLQYLGEVEAPAMAFVSKNFVTSTKQSSLKTRNQLIEVGCISSVSELVTDTHPTYLVATTANGRRCENVQMTSSDDPQEFLKPSITERRGRSQFISLENIQTAGNILLPSRYLGKGPVGGASILEVFKHRQEGLDLPASRQTSTQ